MQSLPPRLVRDAADRLQPRRVGRESGDEHPPARSLHFTQQALVNRGFRSRRRVLENVCGIADQGEHAACRRPAPAPRGSTAHQARESRRSSSRPYGIFGRDRHLDQETVPLRDRVSESDIGQLERADLEARIAGDDVQLHLPGEPLLLQLLCDQPRGERASRRAAPSGRPTGRESRRYGPHARGSGRSRQGGPAASR